VIDEVVEMITHFRQFLLEENRECTVMKVRVVDAYHITGDMCIDIVTTMLDEIFALARRDDQRMTE
jgi:hypothetical protein